MSELNLSHLLSNEYVIPVFLVTIFLATLIATKVKIPYTMILVVIGISISVLDFTGNGIPNISGFKVDPKLILYFVIPPLIFEAMMRIDREHFKTVRLSALMLSTVGVGVATIVGGLLLSYLAGLPTIVAFAFAALIAPTDAAIVIEVFKRVKVPTQLATLMESEASFNDAAGAIIFSSIIAVSAAQGSLLSPNTAIDVNILEAIGKFAIIFFGGIIVGVGLAAGSQFLHRLLEEPFSETALSVAVLFGSVVIANSLGLSGLVAAAAAGLWFGVIMRKPHIISEKVRAYTTNFWEMIAFFANSVAFLYLGLSMDLVRIGQNLPLIALAVVIVLAARASSTYPILAATNRFTKEKTTGVWRNIVMIGGMRGALSVALVATLPESEFKEILKTITFGVVLSSLIIQYPILSRYIKKSFREENQETKI
ncbi:MAG TPA: sodium:proton antiporter [Candidatus Nitrosotalea sp.]|nr:sodium:proton antiporter [Candidatus Nitrosotalea sp.]